jgi:hypothetical protein
MPHTSEIEKALDDLIIDEAGMKFQALAGALIWNDQSSTTTIFCFCFSLLL